MVNLKSFSPTMHSTTGRSVADGATIARNGDEWSPGHARAEPSLRTDHLRVAQASPGDTGADAVGDDRGGTRRADRQDHDPGDQVRADQRPGKTVQCACGA